MLLPSKSYAFAIYWISVCYACIIWQYDLVWKKRTIFLRAHCHSSLFTKENPSTASARFFTKKLVVWLFCCLVVLLIARSPQPRQRDFSLKSLLSGCLVVLLSGCLVDCKKSPTASARFFTFHFSLFTFHFSLEKKFNKRMSYCQGIREEGW